MKREENTNQKKENRRGEQLKWEEIRKGEEKQRQEAETREETIYKYSYLKCCKEYFTPAFLGHSGYVGSLKLRNVSRGQTI